MNTREIQKEAKERAEFTALLYELSKEKIEDDNSAKSRFYVKLEKLYHRDGTKDFRHFYSDIFFMLEELWLNEESGREDLATLVDNLQALRIGYKPQNEDENGKLVDVSENIKKLYDHVNLDVARLQYADNEGREDRLKQTIQSSVDNLNEKTEEKIKELEEKTNQLEKRIKTTVTGVQKEHITILGIFAAIVLAFTGGMTFSTSVLKYMGEGNIYRILVVALVVGIVLVDALFVLLHYICRIIGRPTTTKAIKIANAVLIAMLAAVLLAWRLGWVEYRDKKINEIEKPQETVTEQITEKQN